jgi:NAD(P)-dependent dehydrogenase (short-subunit alcohol dehydrogenase family)
MSSLIVVTGAAGALGRAVARVFLDQGDAVLLVDYNESALRAAYEEVPGEKIYVVADLTDGPATRTALEQALQAHGSAAVLCNIAGGFDMGQEVHATDDAVWQRMLDMNVSTTLNACRAIVPGMLAAGRGKVINVAATAATRGQAAMGAYCASKSVVARITESMAAELREKGINVNAIAPSIIDTPANRGAMPDADPSKWVSTAQLADVVSFLASDRASAIHGAVIPVVGLS